MSKLFRFVVQNPIVTIILTLVLVAIAASGAKNLVFKSDYRVFFSDENPQLTAYESMQRIYSKSDNVAFILAPKSGKIFTKKNLKAIQQLTEASWQVPYSTRVDSITNYQYSRAEGDNLIVEDLVMEPDLLDDAGLKLAFERAINEPFLVHKMISIKGDVAVINVTEQLPGIDLVAEVPEVAAFVRNMRDEFVAANPQFEVYLSGMVMMNNSFPEVSIKDSSTLIPIMFLVVILTIGLLLRTITGTLATLVVIFTSIAATMGLAGWAGMYLTGPSASAPTMILTLAVADCIHILTTLFYEMRHGMEKRKAILESLRINLQPIFLTSVTTAIGFLSMNFSDSPPFRDLGNMVAVGVMLAFVFSITIFPAMLSLLPLKVKAIDHEKPDFLNRFAEFVIRHRKRLLPLSAMVMAGFIVLAPLNDLDDDFVKYFDKSVPFRQATDFMQEHLSGLTLLEMSIETGESSGINEPEFIRATEDFSNWLRKQPETDHVNSITDVLKRLNRNMHGDDPDWYKIPDERELAAQYLLLYEMSLPYGLDLNNQLNVDKSATRIIATFENITSKQIIDMERRIQQWFAENASQYDVTIASPSLMFAYIGQRNIKSMLLGVSLALVLISILLGIALRSVRFGLISLLPNLLPAAVGFGVWFLINGQIGLALSVVLGMTLGIVVDDTVHFLSKYLRARREKNASSEEAVRYAFASVGRALWITTFVLVCGFTVLAQSTFKLNADMGLLTAITIVVALAVDFLFLPPLLMLLDSKQNYAISKDQGESNV